MSNLTKHAEAELRRVGYTSDSQDKMDYDIWLATMEIVRIFAACGHSGASAAVHTHMINQLLQFKPLGPITTDTREWMLVELDPERRTHQNTRRSTCFSNDEGRTHYDIDEDKLPWWKRPFIRNTSGFRLHSTLPYNEEVQV